MLVQPSLIPACANCRSTPCLAACRRAGAALRRDGRKGKGPAGRNPRATGVHQRRWEAACVLNGARRPFVAGPDSSLFRLSALDLSNHRKPVDTDGSGGHGRFPHTCAPPAPSGAQLSAVARASMPARCTNSTPRTACSPPCAGLIDPDGFDDFRVVIGENNLKPPGSGGL